MVSEIVEQLEVDARVNDYLITGVMYPYQIMKKLNFSYRDIKDLWELVHDLMSFCLAGNDYTVYNRLSQFNDYIYLFLLLNRGGKLLW